MNVIHLDMVNTAQYIDACGGRPTVLSLNDSPSRSFGLLQTLERRGWRRLLLAQQQRAYLRVEKELCPRFTRVHVVSLQEKEYLTTVAGLSNVVLIPISVDDRYFCIPETTGGMRMISIYNSAVAGIQAAVLKFAEREWAAIKRRFPAAHWTILGGRGASRGIRQRLGSFKDVVVQDWVASDVEALAQSSIYLAFDQLRGGMKNRVVQAMAAGRAVVGTPAALEGVDGREGTHFYVCEDSGSMRRASEELLRSADLQIQMGRAARDLAGELYSRDVVGEQWRRLYKEVAGPRRH